MFERRAKPLPPRPGRVAEQSEAEEAQKKGQMEDEKGISAAPAAATAAGAPASGDKRLSASEQFIRKHQAAAQAAEAWVKRLLQEMGRTGSVRAEQRGTSVTVHVDVGDGARHMVGRGGTTLRAIQTLMEQALHGEFSGVAFRIDIARSDESELRIIDVTSHAHIFGHHRGAYYYEKIIEKAMSGSDIWVGTRAQIAEHVLAQG